MDRIDEVLEFWLDEVGPDGWYACVPGVDAAIRRRFMDLWRRAGQGGLADWCATARGTLAFLIVTDQMPRNMFRGDGRAFATDAAARDAGRAAIARNHDLDLPEPERVFFYMPFEHSEDAADQDWSVALMAARLPAGGAGFAPHAAAHREIIRRFGRFPYRNAALGRVPTAEEAAFLAEGGYGSVVREMADRHAGGADLPWKSCKLIEGKK